MLHVHQFAWLFPCEVRFVSSSGISFNFKCLSGVQPFIIHGVIVWLGFSAQDRTQQLVNWLQLPADFFAVSMTPELFKVACLTWLMHLPFFVRGVIVRRVAVDYINTTGYSTFHSTTVHSNFCQGCQLCPSRLSIQTANINRKCVLECLPGQFHCNWRNRQNLFSRLGAIF